MGQTKITDLATVRILQEEGQTPDEERKLLISRMGEIPWTDWVQTRDKDAVGTKARVMENSRYIVHVYPAVRQTEGWPMIIHLSIRHVTNAAITDFRDFQRIKTELISPDAEAVQIFPAESRLVDSCNQYHLFVFAPEEDSDQFPPFPIGYFYGRDVAADQKDLKEGTQQRRGSE